MTREFRRKEARHVCAGDVVYLARRWREVRAAARAFGTNDVVLFTEQPGTGGAHIFDPGTVLRVEVSSRPARGR